MIIIIDDKTGFFKQRNRFQRWNEPFLLCRTVEKIIKTKKKNTKSIGIKIAETICWSRDNLFFLFEVNENQYSKKIEKNGKVCKLWWYDDDDQKGILWIVFDLIP